MKHTKKPDWLKISLKTDNNFSETKKIVSNHQLHTICESGRCPNLNECWRKGTATFMIGGEICTRSCKFCNTKTGKPLPLDPNEPIKIARSISLMNLKHAVITSVDRDDLPDLGVSHWVETINKIKQINPSTTLEVLIPDFQGKTELIKDIIKAAPDIISHNMETIKRLTPTVRSAADYEKSLNVIKYIGENGILSKSGFMVGLGESTEEVEELMDDLRNNNCKILTIGQYLQPTKKHLPVVEYVRPEQFSVYKEIALSRGFSQVQSGPLVRSSYHAEENSILLT